MGTHFIIAESSIRPSFNSSPQTLSVVASLLFTSLPTGSSISSTKGSTETGACSGT